MKAQDEVENWGRAPDGTPIHRVKIESGPIKLHLISFGAALQSLKLAGMPHSLVLGYANVVPYLNNPNYFGATIGRYANRIANSRASIGGKSYDFDRNLLDRHHLHGGCDGASFQNWTLEDIGQDFVQFSHLFKDGHMGFPGNLSVTTRYSVHQNTKLRIEISARSDARTLCNFTNHSYFNLDGTGDIRHHRLQVMADRYLATDEEGIPQENAVRRVPPELDFRAFGNLLKDGVIRNLDHNFCLANERRDLRPAATLVSEKSGLCLELTTTEPGLQVYSGGGLVSNGKNQNGSDQIRPHAGIALEPQIWPDAPNHAEFPSAMLSPGQSYQHITCLEFSKL